MFPAESDPAIVLWQNRGFERGKRTAPETNGTENSTARIEKPFRKVADPLLRDFQLPAGRGMDLIRIYQACTQKNAAKGRKPSPHRDD